MQQMPLEMNKNMATNLAADIRTRSDKIKEQLASQINRLRSLSMRVGTRKNACAPTKWHASPNNLLSRDPWEFKRQLIYTLRKSKQIQGHHAIQY